MEPLTERQEQVLDFIRSCIKEKHLPPTVREMCDHFGFAGPNATVGHLKALVRKGYIQREFNRARGITLIEEEKPRGIPLYTLKELGSGFRP